MNYAHSKDEEECLFKHLSSWAIGSGVCMVLQTYAVILRKSPSLLLGMKPMNLVHMYDREEFLFQNYEFHAPGSGVLVLGHSSNDFTG